MHESLSRLEHLRLEHLKGCLLDTFWVECEYEIVSVVLMT